MQDWSAQNFVQDAGLRVRASFRPPGVLFEKRHENTRWSRVAAPADLDPPKELGFGFGCGLGFGSGRSGPTFKVEIDHTRSAQVLCRAVLHITRALYMIPPLTSKRSGTVCYTVPNYNERLDVILMYK